MMDDPDDSPEPQTLDQFREKWQQELSTTKHDPTENEDVQSTTGCDDTNETDDQVMKNSIENTHDQVRIEYKCRNVMIK